MSWSHTLHLPSSRLANRSNPKLIAKNLERVTTDLYRWQAKQTERPVRILHDGPPYANGELHMGHALNKILKDMINRHGVNAGYRVEYIPGWDCHGLPIEHTALKKAKNKGRDLAPAERRSMARKLAMEMVAKQQEGFVSFGVMADWKDPSKRYLSLTNDYVVRELKVFAKLFEKNLIFRQRKPVFWSVESGTALAESELVYGDHISTYVYVAYPLENSLRNHSDVFLAVWTTTPWTLPSNQAISINNDMDYCIIKLAGKKLVVAESLVESVKAAITGGSGSGGDAGEAVVLESGIKGSELFGLRYKCMLRNTETTYPVITADHVVDTAGTGLVHSAPAHGKEDYLAGIKHGLDVVSPVDGRGCYTSEVEPAFLAGLNARKQGTPKVVEQLQKSGVLLATAQMTHSVPLDWRTKTPVMVRATPQFFIDLGHEVRGLALQALEKVSFRPESGKHRLKAFTESRSDWCISRQRAWGVPIPAIYNKETGEPVLTRESIDHIINRIEQLGERGVDQWFAEEADIESWLPPSLQNQGLGTQFRKGLDTLDVWLDSGSSWTMLEKTPVNYYLEGSDQHRGWFQSSLLTHVAVTGKPQAPYERLITHGFILDENRQKMSKSIGNTVMPQELMKQLGVDGLRLFVAQSDYTGDISLSSTSTSQVASMVKKFRLTFKFLLGNISDFSASDLERAGTNLSALDTHALGRLNELNENAFKAYEEQNFQNVVKLVQNHMNSELSSLYFDAVKDVLYADAVSSPRRRAIQYVLYHILNTYVRMLAPIIPLLTQEVWDICPDSITTRENTTLESPLMAGYPEQVPVERVQEATTAVKHALLVRDVVNDAIEKARADKHVGSSLACDIYVTEAAGNNGSVDEDLLKTVCIASIVKYNKPLPENSEWAYRSEKDGVRVDIFPPSHHKCPRCWQYTAPAADELCGRCEDAVKN